MISVDLRRWIGDICAHLCIGVQLIVGEMIDMCDSAQSVGMEMAFSERSNEHSRKNDVTDFHME